MSDSVTFPTAHRFRLAGFSRKEVGLSMSQSPPRFHSHHDGLSAIGMRVIASRASQEADQREECRSLTVAVGMVSRRIHSASLWWKAVCRRWWSVRGCGTLENGILCPSASLDPTLAPLGPRDSF